MLQLCIFLVFVSDWQASITLKSITSCLINYINHAKMLLRLLAYLASSFIWHFIWIHQEDPSAQFKLQKSFPQYITIYSNNYLNGGSQLQIYEECKQSCTIQFSVFHFFSLPLLLLQPFTAQVSAINIEINYNISKYYLEQISIEIVIVMIITVLCA